MQDHERLEQLLDRWEDARRSGQPVSATQLCADTPDLREPLERRIAVMEWVLRQEAGPPAESLAMSQLETALSPGERTGAIAAGHQLQVGDTFDGLELVRLIGRGGMGEVWEANEPRLGRRVAVKFIRRELAADLISVRRFAREAMACAAVQHENVLTLHTIGAFRDRPYLVMPLLDGESLAARLVREPTLPFAEATRIGRAVAAGLAALHARGLTHRDVKPGNIWLGTGGTVKVLDLGLARSGDGSLDGEPVSRNGAVVGTPEYMAPEQADGRPVDGRSDVFSLGVVLYQMTTGVSPFAGPSMLAALSALANRTPPPPSSLRPDLPPAFDELVNGLLAKDPAYRTPDTSAEVVDQLDAVATGDRSPIPIPIPVPVATATPRPRRRWPLAVVGGLLLAGLLVWLLWPRVEPPTPDEQVREVARRLREQPLEDFRAEDKVGGVAKNLQHFEFTFTGATGVPVCSTVKDGAAVIKLPYTGRCDRVSWHMLFGKRVTLAPTHESNPVDGVMEVSVAVGPDGVRVTDYKQVPAGKVLDANHDANVSARDAVLTLVREVLPEK